MTVRLSPITKRLSALRAARRFLLRAGEAEAILVVKSDRLTRSVHDLGVLLDEYFTHSRFALLSVSENIDTRSAGGRLVLNVLASVARWEREAIGERTKAALGVKRHRGQYTGGRPPYGWRLGTDGITLDPDPAEQAVIAEAGTLRERGWSLRRIAVELRSGSSTVAACGAGAARPCRSPRSTGWPPRSGHERLMAYLQRRPSGKYQVRWHDPDGRERGKTFPTRKHAEAFQVEVEACTALGQSWLPAEARDIPDLEDVIARYLEHRSHRLRATTVRRYTKNLDLFRRFLRSKRPSGALPANLLTRPLLEDFYVWLMKPETSHIGRARSKDTARKLVEVVQLMWRWAEESERWPNRVARPRRIEMPREAPRPPAAPTWEEMDPVRRTRASRRSRQTGFASC